MTAMTSAATAMVRVFMVQLLPDERCSQAVSRAKEPHERGLGPLEASEAEGPAPRQVTDDEMPITYGRTIVSRKEPECSVARRAAPPR